MKAILVIDMPSNCDECKCNLRGRCVPMDNNTPIEKGKPSWCPLRPMPEKFTKKGWDTIAYGWNKCIDEIMGETE